MGKIIGIDLGTTNSCVADYIFDDELVLLAEDGGNFGSKERPIAYSFIVLAYAKAFFLNSTCFKVNSSPLKLSIMTLGIVRYP